MRKINIILTRHGADLRVERVTMAPELRWGGGGGGGGGGEGGIPCDSDGAIVIPFIRGTNLVPPWILKSKMTNVRVIAASFRVLS